MFVLMTAIVPRRRLDNVSVVRHTPAPARGPVRLPLLSAIHPMFAVPAPVFS